MQDVIGDILNNPQYMLDVIADKQSIDTALFIGKENPYNHQTISDLAGIKAYFISYLMEPCYNDRNFKEIENLQAKLNKLTNDYNNLDSSISFGKVFKDLSFTAATFILFGIIFGVGIMISGIFCTILTHCGISESLAINITIFLYAFICCTIAFSDIATSTIKIKISELKQQVTSIVSSQTELLKSIEQDLCKLNSEKYKLDIKIKEAQQKLDTLENTKQRILNANPPSYPWLAKLYADFQFMHDEETAILLKKKRNPAIKASNEVSRIAKEKRELLEKYKMLEYQLNYYEKIFPWLEDFKEVDTIETYKIINDFDDNVTDEYSKLKNWLSPEEYQNLSNVQKYQLALDRYKNRKNKSNWDIGIEYERYIGYLYELKGYKVIYNGALEGVSDFGRDIIAEDKNKFLIIQCKYWKKEKTIHEKHIFQLYGTMILKKLETKKDVFGLFITSASLSETAKKVARELNIEVVENKPMDTNYPCIKCNINRQTGEKIYHLPFDQQYDKIIIESKKGEKYVDTVQNAENLGFRRASKWISSLD